MVSLPAAPTSLTLAPARLAASAWLAPLPPGAVENSLPGTVSPGAGMRLDLADEIEVDRAENDNHAMAFRIVFQLRDVTSAPLVNCLSDVEQAVGQIGAIGFAVGDDENLASVDPRNVEIVWPRPPYWRLWAASRRTTSRKFLAHVSTSPPNGSAVDHRLQLVDAAQHRPDGKAEMLARAPASILCCRSWRRGRRTARCRSRSASAHR